MSVAELRDPVAAAVAVRQASARRRGAFLRLYRSEVRLLLVRRRNAALLLALAALPVLIGVAVKLSTPRAGQGPAFLGQITGNGLFLVFTALTVALPIFLPLAVGVVSGDSIAGEAATGTLRYVLTVPVTRGRFLTVKTLGVATYTTVAVGVVALVGLVTGAILFGVHAMTLLSGDTVSAADGLLRALGVAAYVAVALLGLAAGGLLVSTLTENPIGAMATTIGLVVVSAVLDSVPQLARIHPWLLTDHWLGYGELLRSGVDVPSLLRWSGLHLAYAAVFLSLAWARLTTKDVTS
jgi:ABC-2 type transport system permease protein